jgi:integrase
MMNEFVEFLGPKARRNIAAISSRDIAAFRDHRQSMGLAPSTLNTDMTVISAAFNAAQRQGHIGVNPCGAIEALKNRTAHKAIFTPEQVSALVDIAEGEWKGLILAAFYTGARLGDCANLQWKHIDLVSEIKTIRFDQAKTSAVVTTVIHPALEDYLLSLPAPTTDEAFLFPSLAKRNISPLSKHFHKILTRANIEQRVIREKSDDTGSGRKVFALSFHSLRHSFTSRRDAHPARQTTSSRDASPDAGGDGPPMAEAELDRMSSHLAGRRGLARPGCPPGGGRHRKSLWC